MNCLTAIMVIFIILNLLLLVHKIIYCWEAIMYSRVVDINLHGVDLGGIGLIFQ